MAAVPERAAAAAADLGIALGRLNGASAPFPLWLVTVNTLACGAAEEVLSWSDRARADRFHDNWLRNRFVSAHCALRLILEDRFGIPAAAQNFEVGRFGKPRLRGMARAQFSLSYSGDRVLIGVASDMPVGVDIERVRSIADSRQLIPALCTDCEKAALDRSSPDGDSFDLLFLEMWTRKEACVKAAGVGLGQVRLAEIESGAGGGLTTVRDGVCQLRTDTTRVAYGYVAAWAVRSVSVSYRQGA